MFEKDPLPDLAIDPAQMAGWMANLRSFALRERAGTPSESCCASALLIME
jgi:hypothetical protein